MTAPTAEREAPQPFAASRSRKPVKLRFEVVAGAHEGAVLMLDQADYRIGSSPDADIVLSDVGVAPEHAALRIEHGAVRIGATGADVTVEDELLPLSRGRRVMLPTSFALGAARICLSDPDRDEPGRLLDALARRVTEKPATAATVLAGIILAVTMVTRGVQQPLRAPGFAALTGSPGGGASGHATIGSAARESSGVYGGRSGASAEGAARELSARLDAAKIRTLRVSAENGRLAVAGKLSKEQAGDWAAVERWFDQTYGGRIVLTTAINLPGEAQAMPSLRLQAIWYGENPYILTAEGERYFQGAILDGGWVIRDIGEDRLLLAKDGKTAALTYR